MDVASKWQAIMLPQNNYKTLLQSKDTNLQNWAGGIYFRNSFMFLLTSMHILYIFTNQTINVEFLVAQMVVITHTALACLLHGTCAGGTAGTCGACTCPSHSGRCFCTSTGRSWWHCGGRSPCSPHSLAHCSGNPKPCPHRHCTLRSPAS